MQNTVIGTANWIYEDDDTGEELEIPVKIISKPASSAGMVTIIYVDNGKETTGEVALDELEDYQAVKPTVTKPTKKPEPSTTPKQVTVKKTVAKPELVKNVKTYSLAKPAQTIAATPPSSTKTSDTAQQTITATPPPSGSAPTAGINMKPIFIGGIPYIKTNDGNWIEQKSLKSAGGLSSILEQELKTQQMAKPELVKNVKASSIIGRTDTAEAGGGTRLPTTITKAGLDTLDKDIKELTKVIGKLVDSLEGETKRQRTKKETIKATSPDKIVPQQESVDKERQPYRPGMFGRKEAFTPGSKTRPEAYTPGSFKTESSEPQLSTEKKSEARPKREYISEEQRLLKEGSIKDVLNYKLRPTERDKYGNVIDKSLLRQAAEAASPIVGGFGYDVKDKMEKVSIERATALAKNKEIEARNEQIREQNRKAAAAERVPFTPGKFAKASAIPKSTPIETIPTVDVPEELTTMQAMKQQLKENMLGLNPKVPSKNKFNLINNMFGLELKPNMPSKQEVYAKNAEQASLRGAHYAEKFHDENNEPATPVVELDENSIVKLAEAIKNAISDKEDTNKESKEIENEQAEQLKKTERKPFKPGSYGKDKEEATQEGPKQQSILERLKERKASEVAKSLGKGAETAEGVAGAAEGVAGAAEGASGVAGLAGAAEGVAGVAGLAGAAEGVAGVAGLAGAAEGVAGVAGLAGGGLAAGGLAAGAAAAAPWLLGAAAIGGVGYLGYQGYKKFKGEDSIFGKSKQNPAMPQRNAGPSLQTQALNQVQQTNTEVKEKMATATPPIISSNNNAPTNIVQSSSTVTPLQHTAGPPGSLDLSNY